MGERTAAECLRTLGFTPLQRLVWRHHGHDMTVQLYPGIRSIVWKTGQPFPGVRTVGDVRELLRLLGEEPAALTAGECGLPLTEVV